MTAATAVADLSDPEAAIVAMAARCSNWGRWGPDDVRGTTNFLDDDVRTRAATLVRRGRSISLAQRFDGDGPQNGWRRRTNPVHTMLDTGTDAERAVQGFRYGMGGADDIVTMPLQCSTQWDGLGHIFDHGRAWNGRSASVVTSLGDTVTGIETLAAVVCGRGVLLDVGLVFGDGYGELADGFAIRPEHLDATAAAHGVTVRRGDILCVRTGQLSRVRRSLAAGGGWGGYAGGDAPGLSFTAAPWLHESEIAAIATDTWGFEVRPNELEGAFQPLHQVVIPNTGLLVGEMWDLDALGADCAAHRVYEFFLTAAPLPVTGAVGAPLNPIAVL
jgi:kynurenine formamidase